MKQLFPFVLLCTTLVAQSAVFSSQVSTQTHTKESVKKVAVPKFEIPADVLACIDPSDKNIHIKVSENKTFYWQSNPKNGITWVFWVDNNTQQIMCSIFFADKKEVCRRDDDYYGFLKEQYQSEHKA